MSALGAASVAGLLLAYHLRVQASDRGQASPALHVTDQPAGPALPAVALAVLRAPSAAQLAQATQALRTHLPAGVELEVTDVDLATATRLLARFHEG